MPKTLFSATNLSVPGLFSAKAAHVVPLTTQPKNVDAVSVVTDPVAGVFDVPAVAVVVEQYFRGYALRFTSTGPGASLPIVFKSVKVTEE